MMLGLAIEHKDRRVSSDIGETQGPSAALEMT